MELVDVLNVDVLLVDYRGYGSSSQAAVTEEGLRADAKAVLNYLNKDEHYTRVIIFGRSLGGAVAIAAAVDQPYLVSAIMVENTFLRYTCHKTCRLLSDHVVVFILMFCKTYYHRLLFTLI